MLTACMTWLALVVTSAQAALPCDRELADLLRGAPCPLWLAWDWRPPALTVVPRETPPDPSEVLARAREYLGVPYVRGGVGEGSFDCSGFTSRVYAQSGYDLPRVASEQFKVGLAVPTDALQPADLLFFASEPGSEHITHVALYLGDDEMIHAATGKGEVTYDRLSSRYYGQRLVGARRILTLPPGHYSTRRGAARPGVLFQSPQQIPQDVGRVPEDDTAIPPDDEIGQLIAELTEPEPEPLSRIRPRFVTGAVTHVGPRLMTEDATMIGLRLAGGRMGGSGGLLVVPEASYFDHASALRAGVAVPLKVPIGEDQSLGQQYASAHDYTKILREISYGQKESRLYAEVGRTASGTLGHGQIMRYYTPNLASRAMPHYVVTPDALSLAFDGALEGGGFELFVDDLWRPLVAGTRLAVRPGALAGASGEIAKTASVAGTWAADLRAPYRTEADGRLSRRAVHAAGLDLGLTPYRSERLDVSLFLDGSSLLHEKGAGYGGALGTLLRTNIAGERLHVLRLRLEGRLSSPTFIPSYFDTTYRLGRRQAPVDAPTEDPLTKLALLEELEGSPRRWGIYGELTYHYARRLSLGLAYEDGGTFGSVPASERYTGRSFMLFARGRNLYLPGSRRALNIYVAYHLRNFASAWPLFGMQRTNEYLFAAVSVQLWRYLAVGGGVRKTLDPVSDPGRATIDTLLELSLAYEI